MQLKARNFGTGEQWHGPTDSGPDSGPSTAVAGTSRLPSTPPVIQPGSGAAVAFRQHSLRPLAPLRHPPARPPAHSPRRSLATRAGRRRSRHTSAGRWRTPRLTCTSWQVLCCASALCFCGGGRVAWLWRGTRCAMPEDARGAPARLHFTSAGHPCSTWRPLQTLRQWPSASQAPRAAAPRRRRWRWGWWRC